ncbi:MAG: hypothetical protein PHQ03_05735 [Methylococcales bacterium]|nr:hypothetical protein [Methylococcales bacterium]
MQEQNETENLKRFKVTAANKGKKFYFEVDATDRIAAGKQIKEKGYLPIEATEKVEKLKQFKVTALNESGEKIDLIIDGRNKFEAGNKIKEKGYLLIESNDIVENELENGKQQHDASPKETTKTLAHYTLSIFVILILVRACLSEDDSYTQPYAGTSNNSELINRVTDENFIKSTPDNSVYRKAAETNKSVIEDVIKNDYSESSVQAGRERLKSSISNIRSDMDENINRKSYESGYSLDARQEAARRILVQKGYSTREAELTVDAMTERGLLPDPPRR